MCWRGTSAQFGPSWATDCRRVLNSRPSHVPLREGTLLPSLDVSTGEDLSTFGDYLDMLTPAEDAFQSVPRWRS